MTGLKTAIITGGNTGLGFACAQHICQSQPHWQVVIACRNEEKARLAVEKLKLTTGNQNVDFLKLDLSSFQSVHDFVNTFLSKGYPPLSGIICNAGISPGDQITTTADGIETSFQVNCLSHFLLVNLLLPHLSVNSRILMVSSELHRNDGPMVSFRPNFISAKDMAYPLKPANPVKNSGSKRYSATKLCLLFYTYELARQLALSNSTTISVNAFNPGLMPDTGLGGLNKMFLTRLFLKYILPLFSKYAVGNPSKSGKLLAALLLDPKYQGITGKYFDRNKIIPSSKQSYDQNLWKELWQESAAIVGLKPQGTA